MRTLQRFLLASFTVFSCFAPILSCSNRIDSKVSSAPTGIDWLLIFQESRQSYSSDKSNSQTETQAGSKSNIDQKLNSRIIAGLKEAENFNPKRMGRYDTTKLLKDSVKTVIAETKPDEIVGDWKVGQVISVTGFNRISFGNQIGPGFRFSGPEYLGWNSESAFIDHAAYVEIPSILTKYKISYEEYASMGKDNPLFDTLVSDTQESFTEAKTEHDFYNRSGMENRNCRASWAKNVKILGQIKELDLAIISLERVPFQRSPSWRNEMECHEGFRVVMKLETLKKMNKAILDKRKRYEHETALIYGGKGAKKYGKWYQDQELYVNYRDWVTQTISGKNCYLSGRGRFRVITIDLEGKRIALRSIGRYYGRGRGTNCSGDPLEIWLSFKDAEKHTTHPRK